MTTVMRIARCGRPRSRKQLALEELVVLAVAVAVVREVPAVDDGPMRLVGDRLDAAVHAPVDGHDGVFQISADIATLAGSAVSTAHSEG